MLYIHICTLMISFESNTSETSSKWPPKPDIKGGHLGEVPLYMKWREELSAGFILQVIWYPRPQPKTNPIPQMHYGNHSNSSEDLLEAEDCDDILLLSKPEEFPGRDAHLAMEEALAPVRNMVVSEYIDCFPRFRSIPTYQLFFMIYLVVMLIVFAVTLCLNTKSLLGLLAPASVAGILLAALFYRHHSEGRRSWTE